MVLTSKKKAKLFFYIFTLLITTVSAITASNKTATTNTALAPSSTPLVQVLGEKEEVFKVSRVIDGDTFVLSNGEKVRMIGIDTPETVDPRKTVQCYGVEASSKTKELILNKDVRLVKDVSERDSFGRLLRYVYVDDKLVNLTLLAEGYARSISYPPDISHESEFRQAQKEAMENKRGLWSSSCS